MKGTRTIILSSFFAASLLASCDMDKYPYDGIPVDNAVETLADCEKLRNGMYRDLRILTTTYEGFLSTEMQSDALVPTNNYGNQWSSQYLWDVEPSDGTVTNVWNNNYVTIAQCNLIINGVERLTNEGTLSDEDLPSARNIMGEAYMVRAMCYLDLATKFCRIYDETTAASEMGVPLVTVYSPSADNSTFPARSSLADTYARITEDIASARTYMSTNGSQEAPYLTLDALTAFEARVALLMNDYDTAINAATSLIASQRYPLINDLSTYRRMWLNDTGTEIICQLFASEQEPANPMGGWFLDEVTHNQTILPAGDMIGMYTDTDIRLNTYFVTDNVTFAGNQSVQVVCINKYPGNPALYTGTNTYMNMPKIFRIAEMYLIAAEAYYRDDNPREAYDVLYELMSARDASVQYNPAGGSTLQQLIRDERVKELCYEGFRWLDLKRYGEGFTRMTSQSDELSYHLGLTLTVDANDHQWLWPIPQDELEANPQIAGQQNDGY